MRPRPMDPPIDRENCTRPVVVPRRFQATEPCVDTMIIVAPRPMPKPAEAGREHREPELG